jgi:DNA-binding NarL/FixJ family response regulator
MAGIVGRDAELRVGDSFVRALADGPQVLLIEGEAGIGKTRLWAEIADRAAAAHLTVCRSQPTGAETSLTFSALGDLLEAVPETAFRDLPTAQRRAIDAALLRVEPTGDGLEQRLVGAALRTVLRAIADERPLVLALDDLQWVDAASATTLGYALRRLGGAKVGILGARRAGLASPLDLRSLPADVHLQEINLQPLSLAALHHLLKNRLGAALPRSTLVRVHEASAGHPLFAIEISRLLQDVPPIRPDQPLPVPSTVRELVSRRVRDLPTSTRELLLALASHGHPTVTGLAAALGRDISTDLEVADREDVARVDADRLAFTHPLFAAAIYADASDTQRRRTHARLARAVANVEEQARHRALAAAEPDSDVAADLERAAHAAAARAAPLAAAELLRMSLRLTPAEDPVAIDERKVALGRYLKLGGDTAEARRVLDDAVATASSQNGRARAGIVLANVLYDLDAGPRSSAVALRAIEDSSGDPELVILSHATLSAVDYSDRARAFHHAREAMRLLGEISEPDPALESMVLYVYATAEVQSGNPLPREVIDRSLELERTAPNPIVSDRLSASLGYWLLQVADDFDEGRRWMEATYAAAIEEGDEGSIPYALSHQPLLEFDAGNWGRAEEAARRHLAASVELGQDSSRLAALFSLGNVLAHRGREAEARTVLDELLRDADVTGSLWDLTKGLAALGALELSHGNAEAAVEHLLRAEEGRDELADDINRRYEGDLVEALVEVGRIDDARAISRKVEARARRFGRHSRLAVAARCRGVVSAASGRLDEAVAALEDAQREHALATFPFDVARTDLVLGRVRRRRRERTLAKVALESALAGFEAVGAQRWAERARAELERIGLRRGSGTELTTGERRVAELAASGLTNRQVADALFLSPKTVEVTLSRAYQKLGVRSRAELGALMARGKLEDKEFATPPA